MHMCRGRGIPLPFIYCPTLPCPCYRGKTRNFNSAKLEAEGV